MKKNRTTCNDIPVPGRQFYLADVDIFLEAPIEMVVSPPPVFSFHLHLKWYSLSTIVKTAIQDSNQEMV